jgi:3-Oxoacyl-[acyl-carrier-protein (ACP)] synthase III C terminal
MFKEVVPKAAARIEAQLHAPRFKSIGLRRYWLHRASLGMNQRVLKKLVGREVGGDIAPIGLSECANTASAGSVITFHTHHADLQRAALGLSCRFCAGGSLSSVVLRRLGTRRCAESGPRRPSSAALPPAAEAVLTAAPWAMSTSERPSGQPFSVARLVRS